MVDTDAFGGLKRRNWNTPANVRMAGHRILCDSKSTKEARRLACVALSGIPNALYRHVPFWSADVLIKCVRSRIMRKSRGTIDYVRILHDHKDCRIFIKGLEKKRNLILDVDIMIGYHRSCTKMDGTPDDAYIVVSKSMVGSVVRQCAQRGIKHSRNTEA